jgi:hypothetical protein
MRRRGIMEVGERVVSPADRPTNRTVPKHELTGDDGLGRGHFGGEAAEHICLAAWRRKSAGMGRVSVNVARSPFLSARPVGDAKTQTATSVALRPHGPAHPSPCNSRLVRAENRCLLRARGGSRRCCPRPGALHCGTSVRDGSGRRARRLRRRGFAARHGRRELLRDWSLGRHGICPRKRLSASGRGASSTCARSGVSTCRKRTTRGDKGTHALDRSRFCDAPTLPANSPRHHSLPYTSIMSLSLSLARASARIAARAPRAAVLPASSVSVVARRPPAGAASSMGLQLTAVRGHCDSDIKPDAKT